MQEAGEVIVDVRSIGRLPYQRVLAAVGVVFLFGVAFASPESWKVVAFFFGPAIVLTWLLIHAFRYVQLVCEHGLVVRNFVSKAFVPWAEVRGIRSLARSYKGGRFQLYQVLASGRPLRIPGPAVRRKDIEREQAAVQEIEKRAGVKLERARR
jgi:hypothetical protein